jgi:hypothetical protein
VTAIDRSAQHLQMGRVVVQMFQVISDKIFLFSALSMIIIIPSSFLRYEESLLSEEELFSTSYLVLVVAYVVSAYLFTAAIAAAIVFDHTGRRYSLVTCLAEIARDILPLTAIAISSFVWFSAFIISRVDPIGWFLLVPGFFIEVMLWIVVPVRTIERVGVIATLTRSMDLTRGHRWPLAGLLVVLLLLSMAYDELVYAAVGDPVLAELEGSSRAALFCLILGEAVLGIIAAVSATIVYFELRLIKEGVAPETVGEVFD